MIQRDMKIGLVLGLVLVIAVVIKLAVDPRLSPEARIMQLNNSSENGIVSDVNEKPQNFISEIPSASEPAEVMIGRSDKSVSEPNVALVASGLTFESRDTSSELRVTQQEVSLIAQGTAESLETQKPDSIKISSDTKDNVSSTQEQVKLPESFDYEKADVIKTQKFHFVLKNETLSDISRKYYGSAGQWRKIVAANPDVIKDPNKVKAGTKLIIP